jgi:hypothetical protein
LDEAGFVWSRDFKGWIDRRRGRAISFETVRDQSPEWVRRWLESVKRD